MLPPFRFKPSVTQRLKSLMNSSSQLRELLNAVQSLTELQHHFNQVAPAYLSAHCQVLGLRQGTLSIAASNGTLAAKLRQLAPELVTKLQDKGCEVSGIRVKVQVSYAVVKTRPAPRLLSNTAKNQLHALSDNLPESPLKFALEKFSKS